MQIIVLTGQWAQLAVYYQQLFLFSTILLKVIQFFFSNFKGFILAITCELIFSVTFYNFA